MNRPIAPQKPRFGLILDVFDRRAEKDVDRAFLDEERGRAEIAFTADHLSLAIFTPFDGVDIGAQERERDASKCVPDIRNRVIEQVIDGDVTAGSQLGLDDSLVSQGAGGAVVGALAARDA